MRHSGKQFAFSCLRQYKWLPSLASIRSKHFELGKLKEFYAELCIHTEEVKNIEHLL